MALSPVFKLPFSSLEKDDIKDLWKKVICNNLFDYIIYHSNFSYPHFFSFSPQPYYYYHTRNIYLKNIFNKLKNQFIIIIILNTKNIK